MTTSRLRRCMKRAPAVTRQTEGHTCGFCAMTVAYRAYGKSRRGLRKRLRVDPPAWFPRGSEIFIGGTLPKALVDALHEDGFLPVMTRTVDIRELRKHLRNDLAIALINTRFGPHWVALGHAPRGIRVYDSCELRPVTWTGKEARSRIDLLIYLNPGAESELVFAPWAWAKEHALILRLLPRLAKDTARPWNREGP